MKKCKRCERTKGKESFYKNEQSKDGYRSECKKCYKKRYEHQCKRCKKLFRSANSKQSFCSRECKEDDYRIYPLATCEGCGINFASKPGRANKFCDRDCYLKQVGGKSWATKREGRNNARNLTHIRRAERYGVKHEVIDIDKLYESNNWECKLCGKPVDKYEPYPNPKSASLDHIIPLSKGGTHTIDNVQLAHLGCNREKYDELQDDKQLTLI